MVDGLVPIMEPELNCSSQCESPFCFIQSGVSRQDSLDVLQRLCSLSTVTSLCHSLMLIYILIMKNITMASTYCTLMGEKLKEKKLRTLYFQKISLHSWF